MIKARMERTMKKVTVLNVTIATIITIMMLGPTVLNAVFGAARVVLYGELDNLVFLLPLPIAVTAVYTVWLLTKRFPQEVRGYAISFGTLLMLTIFYLTTSPPCSTTQICIDVRPLLAVGVFLLAVLLLSLYYLARVRQIKGNIIKRITK